MLQYAVAVLVGGLSDDLVDGVIDDILIRIDADHVILRRHDLVVGGQLSLPESLNFVDLANLADRLEELIGSAGLLRFEE
jgi:hypothetical protein